MAASENGESGHFLGSFRPLGAGVVLEEKVTPNCLGGKARGPRAKPAPQAQAPAFRGPTQGTISQKRPIAASSRTLPHSNGLGRDQPFGNVSRGIGGKKAGPDMGGTASAPERRKW